jgi:hypothetical protein
LNAFSIDNPQQSNKEAYLDLSKPYQQNNPQPTPKKDNQATTILKEVAGATRTAPQRGAEWFSGCNLVFLY